MNIVQLYTLKVIALTKGSEEKKITLPAFDKWDGSDDCLKTLCEEINGLDETLRQKVFIPGSESLRKITPEKNISDLLKDIYKITEVFEISRLPVDSLWVSGKLLLRSEEKLSAAVDQRLPGIGSVLNLSSKLEEEPESKKPITEQEQGKVKENLDLLTRAATYNILTSTDNSDIDNYNNRNIAYEFLQNADDSKRRNVREGNRINNDFEVTEKGNSITLKYSEAGFSLWDFYCIVCRGSSGNTGITGNTGHFGTGFKSIYTLCNCVTIVSSGVRCTLKPISVDKDIPCPEDDTFIKACISAMKLRGGDKDIINRSRKSPIPVFEMLPQSDGNTTTIILQFDNEEGKTVFLNEMKKPANYVFLKNLDCPNGSLNGYRYSGKYVELFFRENANDSKTSYPLYCNLPMDECPIKFPFYVNIPDINPTETRENYVSGDSDNKDLFEKIFGENGEFYTLFQTFAKEHRDIAYRYFPYDLLKSDSYDLPLNFIKYHITDCKFIPCVNNNDNLCSIAEIVNKSIYLFTEWLYKKARSAGCRPVDATPDVKYVESEAALFLLNKLNLPTVYTVLDKLYNPENFPDDKCFSIDLLKCNRLVLYHNNVTADDSLIDELLKLGKLELLSIFWGELQSCNPEKVRELFNNGKVVFQDTYNGYHVCETGKNYYKDSRCKVKSDRIIAEPVFLPAPDINDEVKKPKFLLDEDKELVQAAVCAYKPLTAIWELFVIDNKQNPRMKVLYELFVELMKEYTGTFVWKIGFETFIDRQFFQAAKACTFRFENATRYSAERNGELYNLYCNTVGEDKRSYIAERFSIFENADPSNNATKIWFKEITGHVTGYVEGVCDDRNCIVLLFGEGKEKEALNKFLKDKCECYTFALARQYDTMETMPVDLSYGFSGDKLLKTDSIDLLTIVNCAAQDIRNSGMLDDNDLLLKRLKTTYNLKNGERWLDFHGYGRCKNHSPVCPVCGGTLLIEADAVRLGRILAGREKKVEFPLLMCGNCYSALNYIKETRLEYLPAGDTKYAVVTQDAFENLDYFFREARFRLHLTFANIGYGGERITKTVNLKMTFLHKVLLYVNLVPESGK